MTRGKAEESDGGETNMPDLRSKAQPQGAGQVPGWKEGIQE